MVKIVHAQGNGWEEGVAEATGLSVGVSGGVVWCVGVGEPFSQACRLGTRFGCSSAVRRLPSAMLLYGGEIHPSAWVASCTLVARRS